MNVRVSEWEPRAGTQRYGLIVLLRMWGVNRGLIRKGLRLLVLESAHGEAQDAYR